MEKHPEVKKWDDMALFLDRLEAAINAKSKSQLMTLMKENERNESWDWGASPIAPRFSELANKAKSIIYIK